MLLPVTEIGLPSPGRNGSSAVFTRYRPAVNITRPPPLRRAALQAFRTATVSLMLSFANPEPQVVAKSATWNTCRAGSLSGGDTSPFAKPA